MKASSKLIFVILIICLTLSACVGNGEVIYTQEDAEQMTDGESQVLITDINVFSQHLMQACEPWQIVTDEIAGEMTVWCQEYSGPVDIIDLATVITIATPFNWDEAIVGVVWVGTTIVKVILVAGAGYITAHGIRGLVMMASGHSNPDNDPWIEGSKARANITLLISSTATVVTGGNFDPDKFKCGVIRSIELGGEIIRAAIYMVDVPSHGILSWWDTIAADRHWGGSYSITPGHFERGMSQETLNKNGWTWELMDCNDPNFPGSGGLPPLQQALP